MSARLFVGNVAFNVTDRELADVFAAHVPVEKAEVVRDKFDNRSRGFGFVHLADGADVQHAIKVMSGFELNGRPLRVEEATNPGRGIGNGRNHDRGDHNRDSRDDRYRRDRY